MPTILFIHGWVVNHTVWKHIAAVFEKQGFGIVMVDLPGHGYSAQYYTAHENSIGLLAKDCSIILKKLDIKNPIIVGHSLGSMIAQYMYPLVKPKAMILLGTSYTNPIVDALSITKEMAQMISELAQSITNNASTKSRKKVIDFSKKTSDNDVISWIQGASAMSAKSVMCCLNAIWKFDSTKLIPRIKCPVFLITGANDTRTPPRYAREMKKTLPNATVRIIEGTGHNVYAKKPKMIAKIILAFVHNHKII